MTPPGGVGFQNETLRYGTSTTSGPARQGGPVLCFAGHTDVVPTGPLEEWRVDPFKPAVRDGLLFGRGAADMKSGLAAMVTAAEDFVRAHPRSQGHDRLPDHQRRGRPVGRRHQAGGGDAKARGERIDWCIVGEPSSEKRARRHHQDRPPRLLSGRLTVHGVQGHVAYPQLAENPVHTLAPALAELTARVWDQGNEHFQPTSFQISNFNAGTGAPNVIPGELKARFNLRYSPVQTQAEARRTVEGILDRARRRIHHRVVRVRRALPHAAGRPLGGSDARGRGGNRARAEALDGRRHVRRPLHRTMGTQVVELGSSTRPSTRSTSRWASRRSMPCSRCISGRRGGCSARGFRPRRAAASSPARQGPRASDQASTHAGMASPRKDQSMFAQSPGALSTLRMTSKTGLISSIHSSEAPQAS